MTKFTGQVHLGLNANNGNGKYPKRGKLRAQNKMEDAARSASPKFSRVLFGSWLIKPDFCSFYPEEIVSGSESNMLFVCRYCFKYTTKLEWFKGHQSCCEIMKRGTPGKIIYQQDDIRIYEVDGEMHKLFTQNLSLFAKLFLDTKSVFYDVTTFLYYVLVYRMNKLDELLNQEIFTPNEESRENISLDELNTMWNIDETMKELLDSHDTLTQSGSVKDFKHNTRSTSRKLTVHENTPTDQIVGFFSKEKLSWDKNNLACIVVFPPWQKKGLGQVLMSVSYSLSKLTGMKGGPERPLSEMGNRSYLAYWSGVLVRYIKSLPKNQSISIEEMSDATFILQQDIIHTLQYMNVLIEDPKKPVSETEGEHDHLIEPISDVSQHDSNVKDSISIEKVDLRINRKCIEEWIENKKVNLEEPAKMKYFVKQNQH